MAEIDNSLGSVSSGSNITRTSQLINDGADNTSVYVEQDELGLTAFTNDYLDLDNIPSSFSGDYNDLSNLPNLSLKEDKSNKGIANGYGSLDINGEQPLSEVNDVFIVLLGNTSNTNSGDETTGTIQTKRPLKTIEGQSLEGSGNIDLTKSDVGLGDVDNTSDANKPVSIAAQLAFDLKAPIASPTFTGTVTSPELILSSETASTLAYFDASKNVKSLSTSTYPSLTELAHVKGVTSAIQTQIDSKLNIASPAFTGLLTGVGATQTGSSALGIINISQTWNTTGSPTAIKLNVTNMSAGASSLLMDLQINSASLFSVNKIGNVTAASSLNANGGITSVTGAITANNFQGLRLSGGYQISQVAGSQVKYMMFSDYRLGHVFTSPTMTYTSGLSYNTQIIHAFNPTSGSATNVALNIVPTINQTGGANGITGAIKIDPLLTSAVEFRALDIVSGSIVLPITSQTGTYAIKTSDYLINCTSGTFTVTLPTAVGCSGKHYIIKNSGVASVITVATTSSQTIDGPTTYTLATQYKYVHVVSDGANWIIIANN